MAHKNRSKSEYFQIVQESTVTKNWNTYLDLQVRLFAKAEFELFARKGLTEKHSPILDLGCGPGLYSRAFRKWAPHIRVVAADTNPALLGRFRSALKKNPDQGIEIIEWSAGQGKPPSQIQSCKAAVFRYILQHTQDPLKVLKSVTQELRKGTLVFIIEEDDGLFQFEPEFKAFRELIDHLRSWGKEFQTNRLMGRKIPYIASQAGLKVLDFEILCHTPYQTGIAPLLKYFILAMKIVSQTSPGVLSLMDVKRLEKEFEKYRKKYGKNCFFYYPQVITIARVE